MSKKIEIGKKILSSNEACALKNKHLLAEQYKLCLNMISSPGSGKTTILAKTINDRYPQNHRYQRPCRPDKHQRGLSSDRCPGQRRPGGPAARAERPDFY
jgi:hypothetical protein